jgi:hypothetical protein
MRSSTPVPTLRTPVVEYVLDYIPVFFYALLEGFVCFGMAGWELVLWVASIFCRCTSDPFAKTVAFVPGFYSLGSRVPFLMNNEGISGQELKQLGFQEGWQVPCRGPDAWGYLDYDQLPLFAYRAQFGVEAREPLYPFSPRFFISGAGHLFDVRPFFGHKLQTLLAYRGWMINTEAAYLHKILWGHMHAEPSEELNPTHGYRLFLCLVAVIFGNKGHIFFPDIQNPVVGNGHTMGILSKITHHMVWLCHRRLAIYNPFCFVSLFNMWPKPFCGFCLSELSFKAVKEFAFKSVA